MIKMNENVNATAPAAEFEIAYTTDPAELAKTCAEYEQFKRNCAWLEVHAAEVFRHRGKHFCIAGQELFVADSASQALALARAAHPEDAGLFVEYIPKEKLPRIYAHRRLVA